MLFSRTDVSKQSTFLIRLAWCVEFLAVTIGLTISMVVAISAFNSLGGQNGAGLLEGLPAVGVAALPFILIAVVELCKIPLTYTFMTVKHPIWRGVFLAFVLFLCLITFETMLNGFERNFSNLNRAIDVHKNNIESIESEVALLEKRRNHVVKFTEEELIADVAGKSAVVEGDFADAAVKIDAAMRNKLGSIDYKFKDELGLKIDQMLATRDGYYDQWAEETAAVEERFSVLLLGNINGSSAERTRLLDELTALKSEFAVAMDGANLFTKAGVDAKYRGLIQAKEKQLADVTSGYLGGAAIEQQAQMEAQLRQQLAFVNSKYEGRVADLNARIESTKAEINRRLDETNAIADGAYAKAASDRRFFAGIRKERMDELAGFENGKLQEMAVFTEKAFVIDEQVFVLQNKQRNLQSQINQLINQNQIYRMAMYAYGKDSATEVDRSMVGVVALLWFGSLSLIGSVCGVMLALAGFYLRRCIESLEAEDVKNQLAAPLAANDGESDVIHQPSAQDEKWIADDEESWAEPHSYPAANAKDIAKDPAQVARAEEESLSTSGQEIGDAMKMMNTIAQQANLLALNATIEAAQSGQAGEGFAVVANDVRTLAGQTATATDEINKKIDAIGAKSA